MAKSCEGRSNCDNGPRKQYQLTDKWVSFDSWDWDCRFLTAPVRQTPRVQDMKEYRLYLLIKEVFQNRIPDDQKITDSPEKR